MFNYERPRSEWYQLAKAKVPHWFNWPESPRDLWRTCIHVVVLWVAAYGGIVARDAAISGIGAVLLGFAALAAAIVTLPAIKFSWYFVAAPCYILRAERDEAVAEVTRYRAAIAEVEQGLHAANQQAAALVAPIQNGPSLEQVLVDTIMDSHYEQLPRDQPDRRLFSTRTAGELTELLEGLTDYEAAEVADGYIGKRWLKVEGFVSNVARYDYYWGVSLQEQRRTRHGLQVEGLAFLYLYFGRGSEEQIQALRRFDELVVEGQIEGINRHSVTLTHCVILEHRVAAGNG